MTDTTSTTTGRAATTATVFARNATGLVREATLWDATAFNLLNITLALAILSPALYGTWQFPGGNLLVAGLITVAAFIPLGLIYAMIVAAMPRAGGDYVFISRVFHPAVGFILCFLFMIWPQYWSGAYSNWVFTAALGPQAAALGATALSSFFTALPTIYVGGFLIIGLSAILCAWSNRVALRLLAVLVGLGLVGTAITALLLLVTGHDAYIQAFNNFANPLTKSSNSYSAIIAQATADGFNPHASFDWGNTLKLVPWIASSFMYIAGQAVLGGELKQAAKNSFRAIYMTMGAMLVLTMAVYLGLYTSVGGDFLAAAGYVYNNDPKHWVLAQPNYSYLATIATTSPILQWLISICFTAWYLPLPILSFLFFSRYALAGSMDRILPERIGYVSERTHTPLVAIGIAFLISLASLFVQTIYGVVGAASFAVLAELVGYFLVALAAVFFPYLPKTQQVYRASPARMEVGGVPLISVMGVISCVILAIMGVQFWADPSYFIAAAFWPRVAVVVLPIVAVVIYFVAYYVHKSRGQDISLAFKEIPPE